MEEDEIDEEEEESIKQDLEEQERRDREERERREREWIERRGQPGLSAEGLEGTDTGGIVSRVTYNPDPDRRCRESRRLGRPVVARAGNVIGVVSCKASEFSENLNFAIPIVRASQAPALLTQAAGAPSLSSSARRSR
jgi:hypothetical protein